MQVIPLNSTPSQNLIANLGGQVCQINVYQKEFYTSNKAYPGKSGFLSDIAGNLIFDQYGNPISISSNFTAAPTITPVFIDLEVNNAPIISGVICLNGVKIVRDAYLGFIGDLAFYDTQGSTDPVYSGFGTRYILVYLAPGDL